MTASVTALAARMVRRVIHSRRWFAAALVAAVAATVPGCGEPEVVELGLGAGDPVGFVQAYEETGGRARMGTPAGPVTRWAFGCRQLFQGGTSGPGALMQQPCGANRQVFGVTGDFWAFYSSHGANAAAMFGYPLGRAGFLRGGWRQGFGAGGTEAAYLMQRPGGRVHYLKGVILERYLFEPGLEEQLGFPTSNPVALSGGRVGQEFEKGSLTLDEADATTTWSPRP